MSKKIHEYEGQNILVTYDVGRCIHAAECVKGSPAVFDPDKKPWVDPDAAGADEVAETIHRCPTGALQYRRKDSKSEESAPAENAVEIAADGPLYCQGALVIQAADGSELQRDTRIALCRCGASENKPFCDGAHTEAEFQDPGGIDTSRFRPKAPEEGAETLTFALAPNGPVIAEGPMKLSGPGGERLETGRAAFCRCGASENKPFCDGSHKNIGFVAD